MDLPQQIESLLFYKAEPVRTKELAKTLKVGEPEIHEAVDRLEEALAGRGVELIRKDGAVMLATSREMSEIIEQMSKEELERDLGKAGLETLTVVLYKSPVTLADIDYIRGVNSSYILRALMIRGLVERRSNPKDSRSHVYMPTFELLQYLGITKVEDMPEYGELRGGLQEFIMREEEAENDTQTPEDGVEENDGNQQE